MYIGGGHVGDVGDLAVEADEEARAARHVLAGLATHPEGVGDLAVRVGEQREVQAVPGDELLVALGGIKAHADHLDLLLLQVAHAVAQTARLLGAAGRLVLGIEVEQHDLLANVVGELPCLAVLILAFDARRGLTGLRSLGGISGDGGEGEGEQERE